MDYSFCTVISSPEHKVLIVSYCDHSPSVGVRPSPGHPSVRRPFTFPCLHSNIYKYQPISTKLGSYICDHKISEEVDYGTNQTRTVRVVCPLIRKFAIFYFVYTLASANIDQSVPNLATIHMPIRSQMSSIMGQIEPEHVELFALEFGKIAENDFVYTLSSTNINQSAPNLVKVYMTIRSWMSSIIELIGSELSELSALELENLPYLTLFTL